MRLLLIRLYLVFTIDIGYKASINAFHADYGTNDWLAIGVSNLTFNGSFALSNYLLGKGEGVSFNRISKRQLIGEAHQ